MANKPTTNLDSLIAEAVDLVVELERLNGNRKLSFAAFLAEALKTAGCDEERIEAVELTVNEKHGTDHIKAYLRRYAKALSSPNYPSPLNDPSRPCRIFGSDELSGEMGQHQILAGELQALAVKIAHARFGDSVFGTVENRAEHAKQTTELRGRLNTIYGQMRSDVSGTDLETSQEGLMPDEIARGLCRTSFKRAPSIGPHQGDWPRELVLAVANKQTKPTRERLADKKAA